MKGSAHAEGETGFASEDLGIAIVPRVRRTRILGQEQYLVAKCTGPMYYLHHTGLCQYVSAHIFCRSNSPLSLGRLDSANWYARIAQAHDDRGFLDTFR